MIISSLGLKVLLFYDDKYVSIRSNILLAKTPSPILSNGKDLYVLFCDTNLTRLHLSVNPDTSNGVFPESRDWKCPGSTFE